MFVERVGVPHQLDDAEVAHDVEEDEERTRLDRTARLGPDDAAEGR